MKLIHMSKEQWALVRDNPAQRDTESRAKKAVLGHLSKESETQHCVNAAVLPDGQMIKLDGHTRSLLWSQGKLSGPAIINVLVYDVTDEDGAVELYKQFDSQAATENASDRLHGAFSLASLDAKSRLIRHGGITTALNLINERIPIYDMVNVWQEEIREIDRLDLSPKRMPSTLLTAAILTIAKRGARACEFWEAYSAGKGVRIDKQSDGADQLARIIEDLRARKLLGGGNASRRAQVGRAISCCENWIAGKMFTVGAKATDLAAYIDSIKKTSYLEAKRKSKAK